MGTEFWYGLWQTGPPYKNLQSALKAREAATTVLLHRMMLTDNLHEISAILIEVAAMCSYNANTMRDKEQWQAAYNLLQQAIGGKHEPEPAS